MPMNREILRLAVPNILTNLTVPLVSLVDLGLMGRMPSAAYILAIGFGTLIFNFLYWAFGFLRMATTGMVAQVFGKDDQTELLNILFRGVLIAVSIGLILILFQKPLFYLANLLIQAKAEAVIPLKRYFFYRIYAAPATISIYVLSGWLLGIQDARSVLFISILINGLNAFLSYYFVKRLAMDVDGVALGTVIAQYAGLVLAVSIAFFKHQIKPSLLMYRSFFDFDSWKKFMKLNSDLFIRTLSLILVMSFFKTKAGNIGLILGAANMLLFEFISLTSYGIDGFAFAAEALCGKYYGKNNYAQFTKAVRFSLLWGIGLSILLTLLFFFFGKHLLTLMTDKEELIQTALIYLPWLVLAPLINGFAFIWDGIYIGTTSTAAMRKSMLIAAFLIFLPAFYGFEFLFQNHGIWLAFSIFMVSRGVILSLWSRRYIFTSFQKA